MTQRVEGNTTYTQLYDAENRLVSVMAGGFSTTFAYDASGQRVRTTATFSSSGRTVTHYPFPNYEVEQQQTWQPGVCFATCPGSWVTDTTIQRTLYHLAGQTIATRVASSPAHSSDGLFYFLSDHLGSSRLLTTASGAVVSGSTTHFLPFGTYRGTAPTSTLSDRGFTGHKHDDPLGLVYMNARFYLPSTGRFLSADTIVPDPVNPQSHNRYSYVRNNPLNLIDPTGHMDICLEHGNCGSTGIPIPVLVITSSPFVPIAALLSSVLSTPAPASFGAGQISHSTTNTNAGAKPHNASAGTEALDDGFPDNPSVSVSGGTSQRISDILNQSADGLYTDENIDEIEEYLCGQLQACDEEAPYNQPMIDRQRAIRRGEVEATEEDIRWIQHELIEIALTQDGMTVEDAHVATLAIQGVQNWDIWPTSVYWTYRESLGNSNWDRAVNARP